MNPLDWNGQQFLTLYGPFLLCVCVGAVLWKRQLNRPAGVPTAAELDMNPYLAATLESEDAAVKAAVVALVHDGALRFGEEDEELSVVKALPTRALELERAVHAAVAEDRTSLGELREAARAELSRLAQSLRARGFMRTPEQDLRYRHHPRLLLLAALGLGVLKVMVGLSRDRPVSFLVLLLLLGGGVGLVLLSGSARLTPRGQEALRLLRERHEPLRTTAASEGSARTMSGRDVALATALFGVGGLALVGGHPLLRDYLFPPSSGGGGGSGGDSSSSSSSSGDSSWGSDSDGSSSSGDSGGSSCGSSSGDSGGSSGCGGCGSGGGGGD